MLGSDTLSSPRRLCTDTSSSQNSSSYRNVSSDLDGEDYEFLNILKEMLEGSKESESVIPDSKKKSEVTKDFTSALQAVENSLCQVEKEIFEIPFPDLKYSNMSREEWQAVRSLADDRIIVIKKADKGSCVVMGQKRLLTRS